MPLIAFLLLLLRRLDRQREELELKLARREAALFEIYQVQQEEEQNEKIRDIAKREIQELLSRPGPQ